MNDTKNGNTDVDVVDPDVSFLPVRSLPSGGEVDIQVSTAKEYPRSITGFKRDLLDEATADKEAAGSMFYALPRGRKRIEGPSARFAEAAAYAWGNLRVQGDIEGEDDDFVYASAICWDLEKNVAIKVRVRRRIRDSDGTRYNVDMIGVTGGAATSVAIRNSVLKVIPRSVWWPIYQEARKASLGKAGTLQQKRQNALEWFTKAGVTEDQVCARLGVAGVDDIGEDELITLRGLRTALDEGDTTIEQAFPKAGVDDLNETLRGKKKAAAEEPEASGESDAEAEAVEEDPKELDRLYIRWLELYEAVHPDDDDETRESRERAMIGAPAKEWTRADLERSIQMYGAMTQ